MTRDLKKERDNVKEMSDAQAEANADAEVAEFRDIAKEIQHG